MVHCLRASTTLAEDPSSGPPALNLGGSEPPVLLHLQGICNPLWSLRGFVLMVCTPHPTPPHTYTHNLK